MVVDLTCECGVIMKHWGERRDYWWCPKCGRLAIWENPVTGILWFEHKDLIRDLESGDDKRY